MVAQKLSEVVDWITRVVPAGSVDCLRTLTGGRVQEAEELEPVLPGLFQQFRDSLCTGSGACDEHIVRFAEFLPDHGVHRAGIEAEQTKENPVLGGKPDDQGPAEVRAQGVFKEHQCHHAQEALAEGVPENGPGARGIELIVDAQPIFERDPTEYCEPDQERFHGWGEEEDGVAPLPEVDVKACLIGGFKGEEGDEGIGDAEEGSEFAK